MENGGVSLLENHSSAEAVLRTYGGFVNENQPGSVPFSAPVDSDRQAKTR